MNFKILVVLIVSIIIGLGGGGALVYKNLIKEAASPLPEAGEPLAKGEARSEEPRPEGSGRETPQETLLVKDDFEITLPPGWQEVTDFQGVLLMALDEREEITDEKAKAAGFRTNFSIKKDDLTKYGSLSGTEDYIKSIKNSLVQLIPGISFFYEEQRTIGGLPAFFIECQSTQGGIDFKTLLVFIEGSNQTIWAISFNTLQDSWDNYRDLFYQIAESFRLKYQIQL